MGSRKSKVCLFGTSANPPTGDGGHTGIVKALSRLEYFHEIRVIPVYRHNFSSKRNELEAFNHRYKMCQLSFGSISKVIVSDAERTLFERKTESMSDVQKENVRVGTAELLEMLREEEPESEFSFCLGADTFVDLTSLKWKRSADVLRLLEGRLVVFSRKGTNINTKEQIELVNQRQGVDALLLEVDTLTDVSSSMIRACKDDKILQTSLSPSVLEYMKAHHLFAFSPQS
mmetsp:Transcript_16380/g.40005  ORF Transcript_16380/g.40005 Transcript_16380/m.40005 type:complete len:230 (-) Transcript_16380:1194-1883(-)